MATVAKIAVENTAYHFDRPFDYLVPEELLPPAHPGCRVIVPFGQANGKRQGVVLGVEQKDGPELAKLKAVYDEAC